MATWIKRHCWRRSRLSDSRQPTAWSLAFSATYAYRETWRRKSEICRNQDQDRCLRSSSCKALHVIGIKVSGSWASSGMRGRILLTENENCCQKTWLVLARPPLEPSAFRSKRASLRSIFNRVLPVFKFITRISYRRWLKTHLHTDSFVMMSVIKGTILHQSVESTTRQFPGIEHEVHMHQL